MTYHLRILPAAVCLCVLNGCGSSSEPEARPEPAPVAETAFGDMVGTMDKARGVQDTVDAHKQALDQQLQSTEGESEQ